MHGHQTENIVYVAMSDSEYDRLLDIESKLAEVATDRLTFLKRAEKAEASEKDFVKTINHLSKRIKELEAEVKVGNAFHKVCVQQRNAEIEKVNELEAKLKKVAGLPRKWQDISEKQTQEYTGIYGCADELQAILEQS